MGIVYVILLLTGLSYAYSFNCTFYDRKCTDNKILRDYGVDYCRKTVEVCTEKYPGVPLEHLYCYSSHEIDGNGGVGALIKKDCQRNMEPKCQRRPCVAHHVVGKILMCCCQGNMCNNETISLQATQQATTEFTVEQLMELSSGPHLPYHSSGGSISQNLIVITLSAGGGVGVLAAIFVLSYWWWSSRRKDAICALEDKLEDALINRRDMEQTTTPTLSPNVNHSSVKLIEKIGSGRFSKVWKALLNENLVAVKIFPKEEKQSWSTEKDMYMHPEIKHENLQGFLTTACHVDKTSTSYWMIFDYHEMGSLSDYLKSHVLTLENVFKMTESVAAGLAYLHSEIISEKRQKPAIAHRDVKSGNILVKSDLTCCICDLGLSLKFQPGQNVTEAQGQVGTLPYMSPEVLEGAIMFNRESFFRIDAYALGLVIWEMISQCTVNGHVQEYRQPFEEEVGLHPTLQQMKNIVVTSRMRPKFPKYRNCVQTLESLVETVKECWDHDAEARLTAECIRNRARLCLKACADASYTSLEQGKSTNKSSSESHYVSNGHLQGGQHEKDCTGRESPLGIGYIQVPIQTKQAISGLIRQLDMSTTKSAKLLFYPQSCSSSPDIVITSSCPIAERQD